MLKQFGLSILLWVLEFIEKYIRSLWIEKVEIPKTEEKIEKAFDKMEKAQTKEEFEKAADDIHNI